MSAITITAKRQATLPVEVCEELGVHPGDKIELERRVIDGEAMWVMKAPGLDWSWLGGARKYAAGKSHRWDDVEKSIADSMAQR